MNIDFQQGIITYPSSGTLQQFLQLSGGYVNLLTADGHTDVAFAHGSDNYLFTESVTVPKAWGPIDNNVDTWIYWDLDQLTAKRTFGLTTIEPVSGPTEPVDKVDDLHWFDTTNKRMKVFARNRWKDTIRVFAAKVSRGKFLPLGVGFPARPFAGSQVNLYTPSTSHGRIIFDSVGAAIRKQAGGFFTTEHQFFVNNSPINALRLEANVLQAKAIHNLGRCQVTKLTGFGEVGLASYDDTGTTAIAMALEDVLEGEPGIFCVQGYVTNPEWNWETPGAPLWIHGSIPGLLTDVDPHVTDAANHIIGKPPVARVITPTSVIFDQGLGGKGDPGLGSDDGGGAGGGGGSGGGTVPSYIGFRKVYSAQADQIDFSGLTAYTPGKGQLSVYVNGLKLVPTEFVETSSTTFALVEPSFEGDQVMAEVVTPLPYIDLFSRLLKDLLDVQIVSPALNHLLAYENGFWKNKSLEDLIQPLLAPLIANIQELQTKNTALEQRINQLTY
jgi:hypothetical protein